MDEIAYVGHDINDIYMLKGAVVSKSPFGSVKKLKKRQLSSWKTLGKRVVLGN